MLKRLLQFPLVLLLLASLSLAVAVAQTDTDTDTPTTLLSQDQVRAMVEKSLPAWTSSVLTPPVKDYDWLGSLSFNQVLQATGDTPLRTEANSQAIRVRDGERAVRIDKMLGKVRYVNRTRDWTLAQAGSKLVDKQTALNTVTQAVLGLAVPRGEIGKVRVDTQIAGAGKKGTTRPTSRYEMYRLVTLVRSVNGLPVYASRARGAVNAKGEIQRLQVNWPAFRLTSGLALRDRQSVIDDVVAQMMKSTPGVGSGIYSRLAYAPVVPSTSTRDDTAEPEQTQVQTEARDADDKLATAPGSPKTRPTVPVRYMPAVVVAVYSLPTPYELIVPVAAAK